MKKNIIGFILFLFASVIFLSACGGNDEESGSSGENIEGAEEVVQLSEMPDRPFVFMSQQIIETIDPAKHTDETTTAAVINIYDALVYPDVEAGTIDPSPNLATKWDVSEDGLTYTFTLRDDVQFHSGNSLTADDVVYSMQRLLAIKQGSSWMFSDVLEPENVKSIDDHTVEFKLNTPYAPFVSTLTQLYVVDSELVKENAVDGDYGEFGDYGESFLENNTAGSGPYQVVSFDRSSELSLTRFEDYWKGWEEGQLDEVKIRVVEEEATVRTLLAAGDADMANQWLSMESYKNFENMEGIEVAENVDTSIYHIPMHTQKPPLDDVNVRKAIAYAFDYETAVNDIMNGATQARGPVSEAIPGHNNEAIQYSKDIEKAKEFLSQSKYAGEELEIDFVFIGEFPEHRQFSQLLQNNLKEIGINVNLKPDTWANITDMASDIESSPHMFLVNVGLRYPHADAHTYGMYHPSVHGSYLAASWYDNDEVTKVLEEGRKAIDVDEQMNYYAQAQELIAEDAPSVYIANQTHRIAYRDYITNYKFVGILGFDLNFYYLRANQ
ncbi:ABC transporter substrate-binding protein [Pseudogracilibacillus sp. SO30301A]|uniref:ABC transporter substrate-binding protein n=1 Tax=Pseudogracilibacillus sp. SO30301A TaxID=3098291 RepID=UPI00300E2153